MNDSLVWISSEWKVGVPGRPVCGLVSCHSWPNGEEKEENSKERDEEGDGGDDNMIDERDIDVKEKKKQKNKNLGKKDKKMKYEKIDDSKHKNNYVK